MSYQSRLTDNILALV